MQKVKITQSVRTLIVENKLKEALIELSNYVQGIDSYLENDLVLHTASFNKAQKDFATDQITKADYNTAIARLNAALIQLIDRLPENGNGLSTSNKDKVISFDRLTKSTNPEIYAIIDLYKSSLNKGNLDDEIYFNLGLCYLHLKLFDLAVKYFEKSLKLSPDTADYHYYLGLAYIRGRRPFTLMPNDIRQIMPYLNAAIELDNSQSKYVLLAIIIKYDYYQLNGLLVPSPDINTLTNSLKNKKIDTYEIQRLRESVPIVDTKLTQFIKQF